MRERKTVLICSCEIVFQKLLLGILRHRKNVVRVYINYIQRLLYGKHMFAFTIIVSGILERIY